MNFLRYIILAFLIAISIRIYSQIPDDVYLKLDKGDERRIERSKEYFADAKSAINEAVTLYQAIPDKHDTSLTSDQVLKYEEALFQLQTASSFYKKAVGLAFKVYSDGMDEFWETHNMKQEHLDAVHEAIRMEQIARDDHQGAVMLREQINEISNFFFSVKLHNLAIEHEIYTINYAGRALQIYQEFPVRYPHKWDNDFEFGLVDLKQKTIDRYKYVPKELRLLTRLKPKKLEPEKGSDVDVASLTETEKRKQYNIYFMVQVAAHTLRISSEKLDEIYSGKRRVKEIKEDGWWKYQIGPFNSFKDAQRVFNDVLSEVKDQRAFIVAYNFGDKFDLTVARQIAP